MMAVSGTGTREEQGCGPALLQEIDNGSALWFFCTSVRAVEDGNVLVVGLFLLLLTGMQFAVRETRKGRPGRP